MYSKHMRKATRGFTIVEIAVVIAVIALLATIGVVVYTTIQNDSKKSQAEGMVNVMRSALERYYDKNGEYPSANTLASGGDGRNLSNAQYQTIAQTLDVPASALVQSNFKFVPCSVSGSACTPATADTKSVFYFTRTAADVSGNATRVFTSPSSGCTYTLPADSFISTYVLAFSNPADSASGTKWKVYTSNQGQITIGAFCPVS